MDEFELGNGQRVRITDKALETSGDHDDCAFCLGRAAAHRGTGVETNPFTDVADESTPAYETAHGLWLIGHGIGATEPGGLLWFEQPTRDA